MENRFKFNRELLVRTFFFTTFAFFLYQLFLLSKPFLSALLVSTMLAITLFPMFRKLKKKVTNNNIAALIMTLGVAMALLIPLIGFIWIFLGEAKNFIPIAQNTLEQLQNGKGLQFGGTLPLSFKNWELKATAFLSSINVEIRPILMESARTIGAWLSSLGTLIAKNAIFIFFKFVIFILSLFFFFRDGERFFIWILNLIPMETNHKMAIARSAYETFSAVSAGVFITASIQAALALAAFLIAGVRLPFFLGFATGVVSLLGASFIITVPVSLFIMSESFGKGLALLLWCVIVVGWIDNLIKPYFIGSRTRMPFILVFFSILGGLKMYGFLGIVLGPMLVACVLTFIRIYKETYNK